MSWDLESTCMMERDELQRLLENTAAPGRQRITSEMPAVTLEEILQPEPGARAVSAGHEAPSIEAIADPAAAEVAATTLARIDPTIAIVALSFTVTLLLGLATSLLF